MESDKNKPDGDESQAPKTEPQAPADALSRTPDDLEKEEAEQKAANPEKNAADTSGEKKISPLKKFFRKVNLYILIFTLMIVVAGAVTIVNYLNSQKAPPEPNIANQSLSQDTLKELANTDATVGNTSQTLTIQGNAVIAGQTLLRGTLNVAGSLQTGGNITAPGLTVSGKTNLGASQINSLQVAQNTAIQGTTTLRDLNVSGTSSFSGAVTVSQITATKLILNGNAVLQIPNHLAFTGPSPSRTSGPGTLLGGGGTVSIDGSDTNGSININTGNNPTTAGCFASITFNKAFTSQPHVIVSPVGSAAGKLEYYVDRSTTGFSICTNNTPQANKVFSFDYFVTN